MFNKIKTLIIDIFKNQSLLMLIVLPIWIIPQFLFDVNYKYSIEGIILNLFVLFLLYGFDVIRFSKTYEAIYKFALDNKKIDISIIYPASFAVNVFWNLMSLMLIVGFINNYITTIPSAITYYIILFITFVINVVAIQGKNYYNKLIKIVNEDFNKKLEV